MPKQQTRRSTKRTQAAVAFEEYLRRESLGRSRMAWGGGVLAISGKRGVPDVGDSTKTTWNEMLTRRGMLQATDLAPHNCAEAHLWLQLVQQAQTPRDIDVWVVKVDGRNRPHFDSPCRNCQQWVREEFASLNRS